jgi:hypothetical protein
MRRNTNQGSGAAGLQKLRQKSFDIGKLIRRARRPTFVRERGPIAYIVEINEVFAAWRQFGSTLRVCFENVHVYYALRVKPRMDTN